jgi:hypothetical protein
MPLTADLELTIAGPIDTVFSQFIDFRRWGAWMPPVFRPLRGPSRPLRGGDLLLLSVSGAPTLIRVERVDAPHEIRWAGGVPGILHARHTFWFEAKGDQSTRIRSVEPWTGLVTRIAPIAARLQRAADDGGLRMLEGFERWFKQEYASFAAPVAAGKGAR